MALRSGRKFKHADFTRAAPMMQRACASSPAWEDFWVYDDVPDDVPDDTPSTRECDTMFVSWLVFGFVPE